MSNVEIPQHRLGASNQPETVRRSAALGWNPAHQLGRAKNRFVFTASNSVNGEFQITVPGSTQRQIFRLRFFSAAISLGYSWLDRQRGADQFAVVTSRH